ncbi:DUF6498-containing protein [Sediminibacterium sp. C3]|uniref:DUF6498-containing protein n=1 Tax=Sediminibacterium sp. C3 TaxID=1267211 RepID=UPI0003F9AF93|nr:DUF6498-containing protein [Sediminibacterium sp. C3]
MEKRFTYQFTWNLLVWLNAIWFFTGLFVFKWEPVFIILAYVFETIVIGFIAVAKMLLILIFSDAQKRETQTLLLKRKESNYPNNDVTANQKGWATALFGFFVMSMFGIVFFVFIQGQAVFIFSMLSHRDSHFLDSPSSVGQNFSYLFLQKDFIAAFSGIIVWHIADFVKQFLFNQSYKSQTIIPVFVQPWMRIFVQQLMVILGGILFFVFNKNLLTIGLLLILLKTLADSTVVKLSNLISVNEKTN